MGSNNYLLWLESVLGYETSPRTLSENEVFDFRIFDSPVSLYKELSKHEEKKPILREWLRAFAGLGAKSLIQGRVGQRRQNRRICDALGNAW